MADSKKSKASKPIERLSLRRETVRDLWKMRTNIHTGVTGAQCEGCGNCVTHKGPSRVIQ